MTEFKKLTAYSDAKCEWVSSTYPYDEENEQLKAENAKLREYVQTLEAANLDVTSRLQDYIGQYDPTDAFVIEAKAKNAKLQQLVLALIDCRNTSCDDCVRWDYPDGGCSLDGVMRELGLKVE